MKDFYNSYKKQFTGLFHIIITTIILYLLFRQTNNNFERISFPITADSGDYKLGVYKIIVLFIISVFQNGLIWVTSLVHLAIMRNKQSLFLNGTILSYSILEFFFLFPDSIILKILFITWILSSILNIFNYLNKQTSIITTILSTLLSLLLVVIPFNPEKEINSFVEKNNLKDKIKTITKVNSKNNYFTTYNIKTELDNSYYITTEKEYFPYHLIDKQKVKWDGSLNKQIIKQIYNNPNFIKEANKFKEVIKRNIADNGFIVEEKEIYNDLVYQKDEEEINSSDYLNNISFNKLNFEEIQKTKLVFPYIIIDYRGKEKNIPVEKWVKLMANPTTWNVKDLKDGYYIYNEKLFLEQDIVILVKNEKVVDYWFTTDVEKQINNNDYISYMKEK